MQTTGKKLNILIVSATGKLGSQITKECLKRSNLLVNILVRDPQKDKELIEAVEKAGGKVFKGDLTQPESLKEPTKGMHTVISAVNSHDEKVSVDGQISLLKECINNGVERFVPSDFGSNYKDFSREELNRTIIVSPKPKFQEYLDTTNIKQLHFRTGGIFETFMYIFDQGLGYWGDDSFPIDLTCYYDIAQVVAHGVSRPDLTGDVVFVGDKLTIRKAAEIYNKVRGTNIEAKRFGSMEELKTLYEIKRKEDKGFLPEVLGVFLITFDERSTFKKTNNSDFPEINPLSFEEFLKRYPEQKFPGVSA